MRFSEFLIRKRLVRSLIKNRQFLTRPAVCGNYFHLACFLYPPTHTAHNTILERSLEIAPRGETLLKIYGVAGQAD